MNEFHGITAAVIGLARAGVPAARFLAERGAHVLGFDAKPRDAVSAEVLSLEAAGVELVLGDHAYAGLDRCDLIVLSPGLRVHHEPLESLIAGAEARGAEVIGELELASRFCPCPIIAVTGTKGKSTTVKLIGEMLRACGVNAITAGNTGTPLISVLPRLAPDSWAVVEVSSFQLEKAPTFRPRIAVLLSLLEDHQDYHPNLEQYWETKLKIFANQAEGDIAIFNRDDPRVEAAWRRVRRGLATTATTNPESTVRRNGNALELNSAPFSTPIVAIEDIPIKGAHNVANVAAAIAAALYALGENLEPEHETQIGFAITNFQTLPHRLEVVAQHDGVTWINDSQSTIPDAAIAALNAFPAPVTLIAGGRSKLENEDAYDALAGSVLETKARLILIGEAAPRLLRAAVRTGVQESQIFDAKTLLEAVRLAKMLATPGETVVLSPACASFDQFTSYEHRGEVFRQAVREVCGLIDNPV